MGGDQQQKTKTQEKARQQQQTQQQTQQHQQQTVDVGPFGPTVGPLKNILSQAQSVQPFDFSQYIPQLQDYIGSTLSGQPNPGQEGLINSITDTVNNQVGGRFAAAGRSFSPSHAAALGRGTTNALAPFLFGAQQQNQAMLPSFMNLAAGLPFAGLNQLSNLILPIAGLGRQGSTIGDTSGSGSGSLSGTNRTTGTGTTTIPSDPLSTGLGAGLGLLGLGLSPYNPAGNTLFGGLLG